MIWPPWPVTEPCWSFITYFYIIVEHIYLFDFSGYILARNAQQTFCTRFKQILYWFILWDEIDYRRPNDTTPTDKLSIDNFYWRRLIHTYCVYSDHWCDANQCNLHPFICCVMCSFYGSWINIMFHCSVREMMFRYRWEQFNVS